MGTVIALSGVDGSGKTTQAKLLTEYLIQKNYKVIRTQVFSYFILKSLISIFRKSSKKNSIKPTPNKNPLLKIWFILALVDFWLIYIFKIIPMKMRYDFIVADRYFIDLTVALVYYNYMPKKVFIFYLKLLPKADKQIFLNPKTEEAFKRSKEFDREYYEDQISLYNKAYKIDTRNNMIENLSITNTNLQILNILKI